MQDVSSFARLARFALARPLALFGLIAALALALAFPGNGARRPLDAHEAFVARTAVEMQRRGDYVVPYFAGEVRLQKPPLNYWLAVLGAKACGNAAAQPQSELSARLPSIVLGALAAAATAWLGWIVFGSLALGALGALLFATSDAYLDWSRSAQPEMSYTFACVLLLVALAYARRAAAEERSTWRASFGVGAAAALAILAKGPILPALLLVGAALGCSKRAGGRGFLRTFHLPAALAWMLVLTLPYFAFVYAREPQAVEFWRAQMFDRTGGVGRAWWQPFEMYYVGQLLEMGLPWSALLGLLPFAGQAEDAEGREGAESTRTGARFLFWVALVPFVALSFSVGRKGYYLLPILPVFSLLMARAGVLVFDRARSSVVGARRWSVALRVHAVLFALALVAIFIALQRAKGAPPLSSVSAWMVGAALVVGVGCAGAAFLAREPRRAAAWLVAAAACGSLAAGTCGLLSRARRYSVGQFAREVAAAAPAGRPLLLVEGDFQVLLFYADRKLEPVQREALAAALAREPAAWVVDGAAQWQSDVPRGSVVRREAASKGVDPLVLVAPPAGAVPETSH